MKAQDLVIIALKLLGVHLIIHFASNLPMCISMLIGPDPYGSDYGNAVGAISGAMKVMAIGTLMTMLFELVAIIILLTCAARIARLLIPNPDAQIALSGTISDAVMQFAFRSFGLYALATWFPTFVQLLIQCIIQSTQNHVPMTPVQGFYANYSSLLAPATGTAIGLILFFRPAGLLNLLRLSQRMKREEMPRPSTE